MISIIAAVGKNNELGKDNKLIWNIKKDLQFFKEKTYNKKIVMGANTYYSLPKKLENREYIVLSSTLKEDSNIKIYNDFQTLLEYLQNQKEEIMIIGGKSIYELFLPYADVIYLTHIDSNFDADIYFPTFDISKYNIKIINEYVENEYKCKTLMYTKK